jgi:hypothetical protein
VLKIDMQKIKIKGHKPLSTFKLHNLIRAVS